MKVRNGNHSWLWGFRGFRPATVLAAVAVCCSGILLSVPCAAAEIPAWLDDSISKWNAENADVQIAFADIKDSFVWYTIPKNPKGGQQEIRAAIRKIALGNSYVPMGEEDTVTTGKPPVAKGQSTRKKCWNRSYMMGVKTGSATQSSSMLTTLVCEDTASWWAGFRLAK